jgi:hypothetical protein
MHDESSADERFGVKSGPLEVETRPTQTPVLCTYLCLSTRLC